MTKPELPADCPLNRGSDCWTSSGATIAVWIGIAALGLAIVAILTAIISLSVVSQRLTVTPAQVSAKADIILDKVSDIDDHLESLMTRVSELEKNGD